MRRTIKKKALSRTSLDSTACASDAFETKGDAPSFPSVNRRQFFAAAGAASLATRLGSVSAKGAPAAAAADVIRQENAKPGALDWQLTRVRVDAKNFRSPWIEGYCSRQSVSAGESLDIMVSANPARKFRLEIFRLGYYGGRGARKVQEIGPIEARTQPTPQPGDKNLRRKMALFPSTGPTRDC